MVVRATKQKESLRIPRMIGALIDHFSRPIGYSRLVADASQSGDINPCKLAGIVLLC